MAATITSEDKSGYLLIVSKGNLASTEDLLNQANMVYAEFAKYDHTRMLVDQTQTTFPSQLFSYMDLVEYYIHLPIRSVKIAVVLQEQYKNIGEFWQTACTNRGYQYFAFTSFEEARDWLLS